MKRAIDVELERLIQITEAGEKVYRETRSYDADNNTTFSLRSKKSEHYRLYDPDLAPFILTDEYLENIKSTAHCRKNWKNINPFLIFTYDAQFICSDKID